MDSNVPKRKENDRAYQENVGGDILRFNNTTDTRIFGSNNSNTLCGMFKGEGNSKTDACALFCCGIFLWGRNVWLLNNVVDSMSSLPTSPLTMTSTSSRREDASFFVSALTKRPVGTAFFILSILTVVIWSVDPMNQFTFLLYGAVAVLAVFSLWKLFEFQNRRKIFRKRLAIVEYQKHHMQHLPRSDDKEKLESSQHYLENENAKQFITDHKNEIYGCGIHDVVGCTTISGNGCFCYTNAPASQINGKNNIDSYQDQKEKEAFCFNAWAFLSNLCCGLLCKCNIQLFGICAIAQEHRYLKQILPPVNLRPDIWQRDYITMQPWLEYYPSIIRLRLSYQTDFLSHLKATSILSRGILISAVALLSFFTLLALLPVRFPRWQILILYGTILQPVLFLIIVHWMWNRFDLSLDAVVKYSACGFFICTSTTIFYELIASKLAQKVMILIGIICSEGLKLYNERFAPSSIDNGNGSDENGIPGSEYYSTQFAETSYTYELTTAVISAFIQAFFVASCTEELCKYLCFSMIEHPDLEEKVMIECSNKNSSTMGDAVQAARAPATTVTTPNSNDNDEESTRLITIMNEQNASTRLMFNIDQQEQIVYAPIASLVSTGEATTIAMIAVALGFACAENLLYVFVYTTPDLDSEISTLYVRCLFPIHPLCAAVQSIGVCRRDLEHNPAVGIGRIVLPAWVLHGCFDFALMTYSAINKIIMKHEEYHSNGGDEPKHIDDSYEDDKSLPFLIYVMIIPLLGMVYFLYESWFQRERLYNIDREGYI